MRTMFNKEEIETRLNEEIEKNEKLTKELQHLKSQLNEVMSRLAALQAVSNIFPSC